MAQKAKLLVLKLADTADGSVYTKVACMNSKSLTFNKETVDNTCDDSAGWTQLMPGGGAKSATVEASGFFNNATSQQLFMGVFNAETHWNIQLEDEAGSTWTGAAQMTSYTRTGDSPYGTDSFDVSFQFSGAVTFVQSQTGV